MITIIALAFSALLLMLSYRLADGNASLNLIASFLLTIIIKITLPDAHNLPFGGYIMIWTIFLAGLQFFLPLADGRVTVFQRSHATGIQFGRIMVAIAVA